MIYFTILLFEKDYEPLEFEFDLIATVDEICPNNCGGHGSCLKGICTCNVGYIDNDCGTKAFYANNDQ